MQLPTILWLAALACVPGCASEVVRQPAELFGADASPSKHYVVARAVSIRLDSGYQRTIEAGTEFIEIGTARQGVVLKPMHAVLTVEGAHMHEAYPVVQNARIVGFYLPVEKAFSPLSHPTALYLQARSQ